MCAGCPIAYRGGALPLYQNLFLKVTWGLSRSPGLHPGNNEMENMVLMRHGLHETWSSWAMIPMRQGFHERWSSWDMVKHNNTDFTFVLNIHVLTPFDMLWFLHTGYSWTNMPFAFLILLAISFSVLPFTDTTLPRYTKNPTSSISVSSNLNFCMLDVLTLIPFVFFMLTHCGQVMQICVFNTVKIGTSASSP